MKTFLLPTAVAFTLLAYGAAFAETPYPPDVQAFPSNLTRAEVRAQAIAAMRAGELRPGENAEPLRHAGGTRNRDEVKAEAAAAARQFGPGAGESGDQFFEAPAASTPAAATQRVGAAAADFQR